MTGPASEAVEALARALVAADPDPCDPVEYDEARYYRDFAAALLDSDALAGEFARVRGEAWAEGYTSGHSNAMRRMSDEPNAPTTPNPCRAALAETAPTAEGAES